MNRLLLLVFVFLMLTSNHSIGQQNEKYYRLRSLWTEYSPMQIYDANNDGIDELFRRTNNVQLDVFDWTKKAPHASFHYKNDSTMGISPLPGSCLDSLYFLVKKVSKDTVRHFILTRIESPSASTSEQQIHISIAQNPNVQAKGDPFILNRTELPLLDDSFNCLFLKSSYDHQAGRGVLMLNAPSARIEWQYMFAPQVYSTILKNINKDLSNEILLGGYAPSNGFSYGEIGDDSSYACILTNEGKLLWQKSFGDYFSGTYLSSGDFWGDGTQQILVAQYSNKAKPMDQDALYLFSPETWHILKKKHVGSKLLFENFTAQQFCHDYDGDGKDEFIVGSSDGFVRLFNEELLAEKISKNFRNPIWVACTADINNDKRKEIICYTEYDRIFILDSNLKLLYEHPLHGYKIVRLLPLRRERDTLLFLRYSKPKHPLYSELLIFEESKFPFNAVQMTAVNWILYISIVIALLLLIFFFTRKSLLLHSFHHLMQQAQIYDQSLLLSKSHRIKSVGSKWIDILNNRSDSLVGKTLATIDSTNAPLIELLQEMIKSKQGERIFSATIDGSQTPIKIHIRFLPALRMYNFMVFDITVQDHIKQVQMWAKVAQKLAHGIKNPLTSVKLNAEELRDYLKEKSLIDEGEISDYIQSITDQVDKLKRMSDGFMRFVEFEKPELRPYDFNELVQELVAQWKPAQSTDIRINLDLAPALPPALLDKQQFVYGFQNIFFNALDSLNGKGRIEISTRPAFSVAEVGTHKQTFIDLRIQDTGCGIPPEYLDKIIQPYFTTKKDGTGLGLSIVEKIIDSHDGFLDIQSTVNEGTTVIIRLRTKS